MYPLLGIFSAVCAYTQGSHDGICSISIPQDVDPVEAQ